MFEQFFLNWGLSFTTAKLVPYLLALLLGGLIVYLLRRKLKFRNRLVTILLRLVIIAIPFAAYFAFYPIYVGDFSNASETISRTTDNQEISGKKLYVITIPYCPYCEEAVETMKKLKERNANMDIEYVVCSEDSETLSFYEDAGKGAISVRLAEDPGQMSVLATGRFPTFVLSEEGKELKRWDNSSFGVRALDEVEAAFE